MYDGVSMGWFDLIIVQPVFNLLLLIYGLIGDFGVAIILFTLIVKFAMWPLAKKQLRQTKLMRKIQPELAEIKKRCKGNRTLESIQMMDLYKRNNIKPFSSILTLVIQLPIFITLYRVVTMVMATGAGGENMVGKYAYGFMNNIPMVEKLISQPDGFKPYLFGFVDLQIGPLMFGVNTLSAIILLVFVLTAAYMQYVVARQTMPSKKNKRKFREIMRDAGEGKEANQDELNAVVQGQMSKFMPVMMLLIMINLPGAVILYYLVTNIFTVVQQKVILGKNEEDMDAAADRKILKELRDVEEAQVIEKKSDRKESSDKVMDKGMKGYNVTRISVDDKKGAKGGKLKKRRK